MESNNFVYLAAAALIAGVVLYAASSKERQENGEWSSGLQWGYLLGMVGIFGILSFFMSFTAVLLVFVLATGIIWLVHKGRLKKSADQTDNGHFTDYMGGFFPIILVVFVLRTFVAEPFQIPSSSMRPGLVKGDFILVNKFAYGIRTPILNNVLIPTGNIERGDVVVFNYPVQPEMNYIKRVVGLPGDTVEYKDKILKVNGNIIETDTEAGSYVYPNDDVADVLMQASLYRADFAGRSFEVLKGEQSPSVRIDSLWTQSAEMEKWGKQAQLEEREKNCTHTEDGSGFVCKVPQGRYFMMGDNRDNSSDSRYWGFVDDKLIVGKAFFIWMNFGDFKRIGSGIR